MSHFNKHVWAVFPLLSILSLSPNELQSRNADRSLASVVEAKESKHPRFEKLVSKVDKGNAVQDITVDQFLVKTGKLVEDLKREKEAFKADLKDKNLLDQQRKRIEKLVADIVVLEEELKVLKDKKLLKAEDEDFSIKSLVGFKDEAEKLLVEQDKEEVLLAKAEGPKVEPKTEPKVEEPKKEEPKPEAPVVAEEPKKEEAPKQEEPKTPVATETPAVAVAEKPEEKKEEAKEEKPEAKAEEPSKEEAVAETEEPSKEEKPLKGEVCSHDKEKVLTPNAEQLIQQQSMIMQQMMMMTSMMMNMYQQYQIFQMQQQLQNQNPVNQQAYQFTAPGSGGNWVFMPNGGFNRGLYPDQLGPQMVPQQPQQPQVPMQPQPGYNGWGLAPQNYFSDPRMNSMPLFPGQFGAPALGYNMGQGPVTGAQVPFAPTPQPQTFQI